MNYKVLLLALFVMVATAGCGQQNSAATKPVTAAPNAEIKITSAGFEPAELTVTAGTQVIFKNTDTKPHWPASNPHPTHTDLPGFDALHNMGTGETYSFTFSKVGTWGYHDHLNPTHKGSIIVTK